MNTDSSVESTLLGDDVLAWRVTDMYRHAVDAAIFDIQCDPLVMRSEFYRPWRIWRGTRPLWQATGYTALKR